MPIFYIRAITRITLFRQAGAARARGFGARYLASILYYSYWVIETTRVCLAAEAMTSKSSYCYDCSLCVIWYIATALAGPAKSSLAGWILLVIACALVLPTEADTVCKTTIADSHFIALFVVRKM